MPFKYLLSGRASGRTERRARKQEFSKEETKVIQDEKWLLGMNLLVVFKIIPMGKLILNYESSEIFEHFEKFRELIHLKKCDLPIILFSSQAC